MRSRDGRNLSFVAIITLRPISDHLAPSIGSSLLLTSSVTMPTPPNSSAPASSAPALSAPSGRRSKRQKRARPDDDPFADEEDLAAAAAREETKRRLDREARWEHFMRHRQVEDREGPVLRAAAGPALVVGSGAYCDLRRELLAKHRQFQFDVLRRAEVSSARRWDAKAETRSASSTAGSPRTRAWPGCSTPTRSCAGPGPSGTSAGPTPSRGGSTSSTT